MANDIVLGAAMRSNLLSLQNTQRSIDSTQLRLATGKKVNSALDNPQSFFQAQSLNNRASDLTRLLDGIGQSIRTIEEADKGISAMTKLVEQASSIADEAQAEIAAAQGLATITGTKDLRGINLTTQSNGTLTAAEDFSIRVTDKDIPGGTAVGTVAIAANDTVYNLVAKINADVNIKDYVRASVDSQGRLKIESLEEGAMLRISDSATAANSLDADGFAFLGFDHLVKTENLVAANRLGGTAVAGRVLESKVSGAGTVGGKYQSSATLATATYLGAAGQGVTLSITIDGKQTNIAGAVTGADTIQSVVDKINNSGLDDLSATFNVDTGRIELKFGNKVGSAELEFVSTAAATVPSFGFGTGAATGTLAIGNAASEQFTFIGSSASLDQYTKDFNKVRDQIDGIVKDANYRGVNLLGGDTLTSYFNEDRSSTLVTDGQDLTVLGLGITKANFIDAASIEKSANEVRAALDSVRAFGASIANDLSIIQTRRDFTEQTINTLKAGASDLTDADLNEEGANLLALQTAQQLGVTSLSLASQSQQSVLRLF